MYEAFISFKNTSPETGAYTPDRQIAETLHRKLTDEGLEVFFSEKDLSEPDFIDEIYTALDSATLLIVVGTRPDYVTSKWVKSEWTNFFGAINSGRKPNGEIITLLDGMTQRELPLQLANLKSFNTKDIDECVKYIFKAVGKISNSAAREYEEQLRRQRELEEEYVHQTKLKLQKAEKKAAEAAAKKAARGKNAGKIIAIAASLAVVAALIWGMVIYPTVIKKDEETTDDNAETETITSAADSDEYVYHVYNDAACEYLDLSTEYSAGDHLLFGSYEQDGDLTNGKEAVEWRVLEATDGQLFLLSEYLLDQKLYHSASSSSQKTWETSDLRQWLNSEFIDEVFSDDERERLICSHVRNKCVAGDNDTDDFVFCLSDREIYIYLNDVESRKAKHTVFSTKDHEYIGNDIRPWWLRTIDSYNTVMFISSNGNATTDSFTFEAGTFVRPAIRIQVNEIIDSALRKPAHDIAAAAKDLRVYNDAKCDYFDSYKAYSVGDHLLFGSYEQDADEENGKEAIEWRVLDTQDGRILLMSQYLLDCKKFNEKSASTNWADSTLRAWLNGEFFDSAFSADEKEMLIKVSNTNYVNEVFDADDAPATDDLVFCLSGDEASNYSFAFGSRYPNQNSAERKTEPTTFAKKRGSIFEPSGAPEGFCLWWLRDMGSNYEAFAAENVFFYGAVGYRVNSNFVSVRPAIWLQY